MQDIILKTMKSQILVRIKDEDDLSTLAMLAGLLGLSATVDGILKTHYTSHGYEKIVLKGIIAEQLEIEPKMTLRIIDFYKGLWIEENTKNDDDSEEMPPLTDLVSDSEEEIIPSDILKCDINVDEEKTELMKDIPMSEEEFIQSTIRF